MTADGKQLRLRAERAASLLEAPSPSQLSSLLQTLGTTLGTPLSRGDPEELVARIGHVLHGHGPALLILDNFEQLVAHGPVTLSRWHSLAPETVLLVSSRLRLGLPGEAVVDVEPLPRAEGIELMIARADGWKPTEADFEVLDEIVHRLDGLPLAIELAAARLRVLSPNNLL